MPQPAPIAGVRPQRIDAHVHLWQYAPAEFGWLDEPRRALRRDFLHADLKAALAEADVEAAIAVQATHTMEETRWLLQQPSVAAIVGWVPLTAAELPQLLETLDDRRLAGFRHVYENEPSGALADPRLDAGLRHLTRAGYTFDLLIRAHQMEEATALVSRHPEQMFILDHAAKPPLATGDLAVWRSDLRSLARRPNVACKLSGLATECDWSTWSLAQLRPVLDTCVEAFTPARLLAASDWPVCTLATSMAGWFSVLTEYFSGFTSAECEAIFGGNARRLYLARV